MNLHIVGMGTSRDSDYSQLAKDGAFRKATRNMRMGYAALTPLLHESLKLDQAAFVLGSSYGELGVTQEFLGTLDSQGVARPLLFQNSLHNATLGFLALKLGVTGPSMTVSHRYFTGENCLEAASLLLNAGAKLCIALSMDSRVSEIDPAMRCLYPAEIDLDEGAGALLLASESSVKELGLPTLAVIESLECQASGGSSLSGAFYDSNAIEKIIEAVRAGHFSKELILNKPNRSFSKIRVSR